MKKKDFMTRMDVVESVLNSIALALSFIIIGLIIYCMRLDAVAYTNMYIVFGGLIVLVIFVKTVLRYREKKLWFKKNRRIFFLR